MSEETKSDAVGYTEEELDREEQEAQKKADEEQKKRERMEGKQARAEENFNLPAEQLSDEQARQAHEMEEETNKLYGQKIELKTLLDKISPYLPEVEHKVKLKEGKTEKVMRPAGWEDVEKWQEEDKLGKIIAREVRRKTPKTEQDREIGIKDHAEALFGDAKNGLALKDAVEKSENEGLVKNFKNLRLRELVLARQKLKETEADMDEVDKRMFKSKGREGSEENTLALTEKANKLKEQHDKIVFSSPEAYLLTAGQQLAETKRVFNENGKIVETAHVKEAIRNILDELATRPAFVHGELSTGKTELAKHTAREYLSGPHLQRWEAENPKPTDPAKLEEWETRKAAEKEPLEVRGMRGTEKEDVLWKTALERSETPLPKDQVNFLMGAIEDYKKTVLADVLKKIDDPEERKKVEERAINQLEKGYMDSWRSGIVTTEKLSPIFQAMKEGRPVIIDEMNAIPHHVLIVLNDIINKRPGEKVITAKGEVIQVLDGFNVICTGNWKPGDEKKRYLGRQDLDAAYISRFGVVKYDYLPQSIDRAEGSTLEAQRASRQENELFKMMMVRLLDNNLGANLPGGSLPKIKELARVSRVLQDVYSEKTVDRAFWARDGKINPKDVLKENVPAYRQLIPILESWKRDGFVRPLDDYIFLKYVSRSQARPEEMKYIYNVLQGMGDFFQGGDWPVSAGDSDTDKAAILNYPIVRKMYGVDKLSDAKKAMPITEAKAVYYSPIEVIEAIYGQHDPRQRFSLKAFERPKTEEELIEDARKVETERVFAEEKLSAMLNNPKIPEATKKFLQAQLAEIQKRVAVVEK